MRNLLIFLLIAILLASTALAWRRRRRCDTTNCLWVWGSCSRTCGGGLQSPRITRNKGACGSCNLPASRMCNTQCCPVNCLWDQWGAYGQCSTTCADGVKRRDRKIALHPLCGGSSCSGQNYHYAQCSQNPCAGDCVWSEWSGWFECTKSCGGGMQTRNRRVSVEAIYGGNDCVGNSTESRVCNDKCCPVDCVWSEWSGMTECSLTCGKDVDKCMVSRDVCHAMAGCNSTMRGFNCFCEDGYTGDGTKSCTDIDECQSNNPKVCNNKNTKCENLPGSFECTCKEGYVLEYGECIVESTESDIDDIWKPALVGFGGLTALIAVFLGLWYLKKNRSCVSPKIA